MRAIGHDFTEQWKQSRPGSDVVTRDLARTEMPFVDLPWILDAYTPDEAHTPEHQPAPKLGDSFVAEIEWADEILLTTPVYDFAVPAALKAWIDHIVRAGEIFRANPDGSYSGLLKNRKVTVVIASAGSYPAGFPGETCNMEKPYLRHIFSFIGLQP